MIAALRRFSLPVIVLATTWTLACTKDEAAKQQGGVSAPETIQEGKAQVQWFDFDDGLARARSAKKPIMINFYTDWCVYCKKFDRETLQDPEVTRTLESGFVAIRLNAENDKTRLSYRGKSFSYEEFSRYFGVTAFPSIAFLNDKGELITMIPGFVPAPQFSVFLNYIRRECYLRNVSFHDFAAKGDCS
ncbi:MAG TPA: thioredoxin family protein [Syntrophobacteria bacterium]|nr:thioredoxin family protein [Syntrophobacteria bacterium]